MVDEARVIAAENDVATCFADETEPARVVPREQRQRGELFRREIVIEAGLEPPEGRPRRNGFHGEQAEAVNGAAGNTSFDEHHVATLPGRPPTGEAVFPRRRFVR